MGRQKALDVLRQFDASPPDYQRILVHSRLGKDQLRSLSSLPGNIDSDTQLPRTPGQEAMPISDWIVLWSDFESGNTAESRLEDQISSRAAVHALEEQGVRVRFYQLTEGGP
jgi:hypothetical protein